MASNANDQSIDPVIMATLAKEGPRDSGESTSALERFFSRFLQESSIKWMLMMGAAITAGCSLMAVTSHWSEWPAALKYLTVLSYTIATFGVSEVADRRFGLQQTSNVLRLLTLVLLPIGFLSLSWFSNDVGLTDSAILLSLLIPAAGFTLYAASRIFGQWLRGQQWTFLVSYVVLAICGAIPEIETTWLAALLASGFWIVMTLGIIKVNRHVFWLVEEHRTPRVFGFVPILLLGGMTATLIALKTASSIPTQWLGLFVVMIAATILVTTRTIADVYRRRTGDLVRPLPWSIIAPLFTAILLIAGGVSLSFYGFHFIGDTTRAIVPTTLVAACLLTLVAKDTRHSGFVWAALVLVTIAYQSTPTLVTDWVEILKQTAATSLREPRLPIAFYGLTYAPLLVGLAIAGNVLSRRNRPEFVGPIRSFLILMTLALLLLSITSLKAIFLVPLVSSVLLVLYAVLLRDRRFAVAALGTLAISSLTFVPFGNAMEIWDCSILWSIVSGLILGLGLLSTSLPDRWLDRLPRKPMSHGTPFLSVDLEKPTGNEARTLGLLLTLIGAAVWLIYATLETLLHGDRALTTVDWTIVAVAVTSLSLWTLRTRHYTSGLVLAVFGFATAWIAGLGYGLTLEQVTLHASIVTGVIAAIGNFWLSQRSRTIERFQQTTRRSDAFIGPVVDLALVQFVLIATVVYLPAFIWATLALDASTVLMDWKLIFAWVLVIASYYRSELAMLVLTIASPLVVGVGVGVVTPQYFSLEFLPLIYAATSGVALAITHRQFDRSLRLTSISSIWLVGLIAWGLFYLTPASLVGSLVSMAAIYVWFGHHVTMLQRTHGWMLASVQVVLASAMLGGYRGSTWMMPLSENFASACVMMLATSMLCSLLFARKFSRLDQPTSQRLSLGWSGINAGLLFVCLFPLALDRWESFIVIATAGIAVIHQWRLAVTRQQEMHVWTGLAIAGVTSIWIIAHSTLSIPHDLIRVLLVPVAGAAFYLASRWNSHERLGILVRGLSTIGWAIPCVITAWTFIAWQASPMQTLGIFGAAIVMFGHGLWTPDKRMIVSAAVLVNLGILSLGMSLSLTDPQIFLVPLGLTVIVLVELLRCEIPSTFHNPIRYAGALAILVAPCFEILGGSWLHLLSLMILSVLVVLLALGLRIKSLLQIGVAFLVLDLVAMVVRSTIDHPGMLWIAGLALGASVIGIAALCEIHRERLLSRIRTLSAELATWH